MNFIEPFNNYSRKIIGSTEYSVVFQSYEIKRVCDNVHEKNRGLKQLQNSLHKSLISDRHSHIPQKFTAPTGRNNHNPILKGGVGK